MVAVKEGRQNDAAIKALVKVLQSQKIKDYVAEKYPNGEVVTVF
ncbi:MetQ/NlpA family ABC transporter substrate-binding protein [Treponema sp.]|nr:MetQ/NlpA family ABC transporter substrate-binding protein [Treponema sp.]